MNPATLAYLNYIYFDTDMGLVSSGFAGVTDAAHGIGTHEALEIKGFVATKPGRLLVYLSNENDMPLPVHFDDLTITHRVIPGVVQTDDYYPFGLTFNSYGKGLGNLYKYNGKEEQKETGWYDYGARMYQPEIGRFLVQDRFSEKYMSYSPYSYAANYPVLMIDVNGDSLWINTGSRKLL